MPALRVYAIWPPSTWFEQDNQPATQATSEPEASQRLRQRNVIEKYEADERQLQRILADLREDERVLRSAADVQKEHLSRPQKR